MKHIYSKYGVDFRYSLTHRKQTAYTTSKSLAEKIREGLENRGYKSVKIRRLK